MQDKYTPLRNTTDNTIVGENDTENVKAKEESQETEKPSIEETNEENNGNEEGGENDKTPEKDEEHGDPEEEDDLDPNSKMIVTTYNPIIVTCHQDSFIRFWTMQVILNLTKI